MGMYNVINCEAPCPKCGNVVQWQSKELLYDSYELANVLRRIDLAPGMDGEMHSSCGACGAWLDATITKGQPGPIRAIPMPRQNI